MNPIRPATPDDLDAWVALRAELWPYHGYDDLRPDAVAYFAGRGATKCVLLCEGALGPVAMIEISERSYADGCKSSPVAFVEAWFVSEPFRGQGIGRALIEAAADWARTKGHTELGSDTQDWNTDSQAAHGALGFFETGRNVSYVMRL